MDDEEDVARGEIARDSDDEDEEEDSGDEDSEDYESSRFFEQGLIDNDPEFTSIGFHCDRDLVNAREAELIGRHTHLKTVFFGDFDAPKQLFDTYLVAVANNRTIEELIFQEQYRGKWRDVISILAPFLENNSNLKSLTFSDWGGQVPNSDIRLLTSILERCYSTCNLQTLEISFCGLHGKPALKLIHALAKLPQLKKLVLDNFMFWLYRSEQESTPSLLSFGVALAAMIQNSYKLEEVSLCQCALGVEDIEILAGALRGNTTLKHLALFGKDGRSGEINTISERGWGALADQLCNTESVNSTYHSNHTLQCIYDKEEPPSHDVDTELRSQVARRLRSATSLPPDKIQHLLLLNAQGDKKSVALKKILLFHDEIAVTPLSEWGIKMLPFVVGWFTNAKDRIITKEVTLCVENDLHMSRQVFDEARIREVFDAYGKVTSVTLPMRHGFGSVTFANRTDANAAILNLDGHELTVPRRYGGNESYGTISVSESKFQAASDGLLANAENKSLSTIFNFCRLFPDDVADGFRASDAIHSQQAKKRRAGGVVY